MDWGDWGNEVDFEDQPEVRNEEKDEENNELIDSNSLTFLNVKNNLDSVIGESTHAHPGHKPDTTK